MNGNLEIVCDFIWSFRTEEKARTKERTNVKTKRGHLRGKTKGNSLIYNTEDTEDSCEGSGLILCLFIIIFFWKSYVVSSHIDFQTRCDAGYQRQRGGEGIRSHLIIYTPSFSTVIYYLWRAPPSNSSVWLTVRSLESAIFKYIRLIVIRFLHSSIHWTIGTDGSVPRGRA